MMSVSFLGHWTVLDDLKFIFFDEVQFDLFDGENLLRV